MRASTAIFTGLGLLLLLAAIIGGFILIPGCSGCIDLKKLTVPTAASSSTPPTPAASQTLTTEDVDKNPICRLPPEDALRYVALGPSLGEDRQLVVRVCENPGFSAMVKTLVLRDGILVVAEGESDQGNAWVDVSKDLRPGGFPTDRYPRLSKHFPGRSVIKGSFKGQDIVLTDPVVLQLPRSSSKSLPLDTCTEWRKKPRPSDENVWAAEIWARCALAGSGGPGAQHHKAVAESMASVRREDFQSLVGDVSSMKDKIADIDKQVKAAGDRKVPVTVTTFDPNAP